jgi:L-lactate dehydrogenase complex protein LldG
MAGAEQIMSPREEMLSRVRSALGRSRNDPVPAVTLRPSPGGDFAQALTALGGEVVTVANLEEARTWLGPVLAGRRVIASAAPIVVACGLAGEFSREACADAEIGVTSADFALADTGTLVFLSESGESRLISLLPPKHIAIIDGSRVLSGLDELLARIPRPADRSSSLVLVTGPSRTADIEMRLVRGVHGPGEISVILVRDVTPSPSGASAST